jgi:AcrR family transcriptional regulator
VDAALAVVDKCGVEGVTIRAVARAVGAPPMSLYRHFASKEELLDLMYGELARRLYADAAQSTWQAELFFLCHQVRHVLTAHPRWAALLSRPASPMAVPLRERLLKLMVGDGMSTGNAFAALSAAILTSIGLALVDITLNGPDGQSSVAKRFERLKAWVESSSDAQDPITRSAISRLPRFDMNDNFTFAVRALIVGLESKRSH